MEGIFAGGVGAVDGDALEAIDALARGLQREGRGEKGHAYRGSAQNDTDNCVAAMAYCGVSCFLMHTCVAHSMAIAIRRKQELISEA